MWIESHQTIRDHPKLTKLCRRLGIDRPAAIGHLHLLWWWALSYAPDGDLSRYDDAEIAEAALWDGDPESFAHALTEAGFTEFDAAGRIVLHDWRDYAGKLIERREANKLRMQKVRHPNGDDGPPPPAAPAPARVRPAPKPGGLGIIQAGRFDRFWAAYPHRAGKQAAVKAWAKIAPDEALVLAMLAAIERQRQSRQWREGVIPHASTWLNGRRWEDEDLGPAAIGDGRTYGRHKKVAL